MTIVVVLSGLGVATGILGWAATLRHSPTALVDRGPGRLLGFCRHAAARYATRSRLALAVTVGLIVALATRWPVAVVFAALGTLALPEALGTKTARDATRRTEAIAAWTEMLRDSLTGSAGVGEAIIASAAAAPPELRDPVSHLADRIMSGVPLEVALRPFAVEVDDPCANEVVAALRLVATSPAQRLVELLSALAESTREVVAMRLRVEASRASARSGVRTIIWFSLGFDVLLAFAARSYLAPFHSLAGQLVLIVVGAFYVSGLAVMVRMVRPERWRAARWEPRS